ncbi:dethiobiotin synthase [Paracoccus sp. TK19116]|uniref:ATP-dependent dethiobiotin synthetase BioD n=1 Tax=Paracoccus albicereus TaxID=2922394 RepID=A0ABT1MRW1_9RHOB|nr:dethiobiotin synthase [Paracoccus albicereus]MCQ0971060.1 dethiobiotin synthase [Paracoccus albicereus]
MARFVISGTGTDIGKTIFAAGLCRLIGADYWKPVQSGLAGNVPVPADAGQSHPLAGSDSAVVASLSGARTHPEAHVLTQPLSPHRAAELDGITLDPASMTPPDVDALVIEGAGGVLVPLTRDALFADLFARWQIPVIVIASTGLGTISHTLSALESLRARGVPVHGAAFVGDDNPDNIATIGAMGSVRILGRLPWLADPSPDALARAMTEHFDPKDFA